MTTLDEKPFRSENEPEGGPAEIRIRMGHPRVRPHVVPIKAEPAAQEPKTGEFVAFTVTVALSSGSAESSTNMLRMDTGINIAIDTVMSAPKRAR